MSAERDAFLKTRAELQTTAQAMREAENAAHIARANWERAHRRWEELRRQLGEHRFREISAGGQ